MEKPLLRLLRLPQEKVNLCERQRGVHRRQVIPPAAGCQFEFLFQSRLQRAARAVENLLQRRVGDRFGILVLLVQQFDIRGPEGLAELNRRVGIRRRSRGNRAEKLFRPVDISRGHGGIHLDDQRLAHHRQKTLAGKVAPPLLNDVVGARLHRLTQLVELGFVGAVLFSLPERAFRRQKGNLRRFRRDRAPAPPVEEEVAENFGIGPSPGHESEGRPLETELIELARLGTVPPGGLKRGA